MRLQLSKGPTITPAMFPVQSVAGAEPTLIGFSGLSELDYVATHLCTALIQRYDPETIDVVTLAINTAQALLQKSDNVRQLRELQAQQAQQEQAQQEQVRLAQEQAQREQKIIVPENEDF
jgi:hypothetical protein